MPKCQFTSKYYDYEIRNVVDFDCDDKEPLASGFCIFHDKDYLHHYLSSFREEHKRKVLERLKHKINHAISNDEPLLCIGFQLPDFSLSDLNINKKFTKPVYFEGSQFFRKVDFSGANFQQGASFIEAHFQGEAFFSYTHFQGEASFSNTHFQEGVSFYEATFQGEEGEAFFSLAYFQRFAGFYKVHFQGNADFYNAHFEEGTDFSEAHFKGGASFHEATFRTFTNFSETTFQGKASFSAANIQGIASFKATFQGESSFSSANMEGSVDFSNSEFGKTYFSGHFKGITNFNYVLFEGKEKVIFDIENLSNVSFMNTDITGVRFSDKARWGEKKVEYDKFWRRKKIKDDRFKIVDERLLEEEIKENDSHTTNKDFNLGSIKAVYRNLRENYEYRMRYDEAGQFFIREMELKRKYREVPSKEMKEGEEDIEEEERQPEPEKEEEEDILEIKQNNWFRRNLFSLTGWYYHLSRYGESIWRPTLAGLVIVFLSILFWLMQENPELEPSLPIFQSDDATNNMTSKFVGFDKFGEGAHWLKASERSIADFIPLLPLGSNIEVGIIDYVIKIVGGAVTFGLIAIALRRRFERRYRH